MSSSSATDQDQSTDYHAEPCSGPYSLLKMPKFAVELIRAGVSLRAGSAIFNALLLDLKDNHVLDFDAFPSLQDLYMDKNKIRRQMDMVSLKSCDKGGEDRSLVCIGVDGRTDNNTLLHREVTIEGKTKVKQSKGKEHHLTFTCESGDLQGSYLTHTDLPLTGATGELQAEKTMTVLEEYESKDTLKAVLVNNTSVNTGMYSFKIR